MPRVCAECTCAKRALPAFAYLISMVFFFFWIMDAIFRSFPPLRREETSGRCNFSLLDFRARHFVSRRCVDLVSKRVSERVDEALRVFKVCI